MDWSERVGRRLKLRDLHILLAVVQDAGMAKASTRLGVSQPAISKAIANMEHVLGVSLLDRGPRGVQPTPYGSALVQRSLAAFDELRQGIKDIEFLCDPTVGEVRIGSTELVASGLLTAVIARMVHRYPRVTYNILQGDTAALLRALEERKVDLVIARMVEPTVEEHVTSEILYYDSFLIVAGVTNPLTRRRKVKLADLVNEPWALLPQDTIIGSMLLDAFRLSKLKLPRATVITSSLSMRNSLLATGHFLTALGAAALQFPKKQPAIKALPVELPMTRRPVGIFTLKHRALGAVTQLFIDNARAVAQEMRS